MWVLSLVLVCVWQGGRPISSGRTGHGIEDELIVECTVEAA